MVAMDALRAARDVIILWNMRACAAPGIITVLKIVAVAFQRLFTRRTRHRSRASHTTFTRIERCTITSGNHHRVIIIKTSAFVAVRLVSSQIGIIELKT
jgi:hypothetical protein